MEEKIQDNGHCEKCTHREGCSQVYEKLGKVKGPNVAFKVFLVFLMPIIVFIAGLVLCENYLFTGGRIAEKLAIFLSFVISLALSFGYVFLIKALKISGLTSVKKETETKNE